MATNYWRLRVAGGNVAHVEYSPEVPDLTRVVIEQNQSRAVYDTQLNQSRLNVHRNVRYTLAFRARADDSRTIFAGCAQSHAPWNNLGLCSKVAVTTEWRTFHKEFVASDDDDNARIHFDLGNSTIAVEVASVVLRRLHDGVLVEPDVPQRPLARLVPVSRHWGNERGLPIDRYYIETFLARFADDIRGRVLEIGDRSYTRKFGAGRVTTSDVLHVTEGNPEATIVGDLAHAEHIPSSAFDAVILTQTLQLLYDLPAAIRTLHRILKPGGVVLATIPGISQSYDAEWRNVWYWNFTRISAKRLFAEHFPQESTEVEGYGNVHAAKSFIDGLATEDLHRAELDFHDPDFDVVITVRAVKPTAPI